MLSTPAPATPAPASPAFTKIASRTQMWEALAQSRASVHEASRKMNVSLSVAKEGLAEAARVLRARTTNCENAVAVLKASGAVKQDISRRAWDQVALGFKSV